MNILFKKPRLVKQHHEEEITDSSSDKEKTPLRFFINCFLNSTATGKHKTKKNKTNDTPVRISEFEPIHAKAAITLVSIESPVGERSFEDDTVLYRICGGFFGYVHTSFHFISIFLLFACFNANIQEWMGTSSTLLWQRGWI
jgi:hypothetical protein